MATYVPVATDPADPVSSRFVGSAAEEFRTLKNRTKGALVVPLTDPVPGFVPAVATRAGKVLGFDATGNPVVLTVAGTTDPSLRADLAAAGGVALVNGAVSQTDLQKQTYVAGTTGGTSTAYTFTAAPVVSAYVANLSFFLTFHVASGAAPTLAINGIATPPNLVRQLSDGTYANISANDIPINHRSRVTLLSATQALVEDLPRSNQILTNGTVQASTSGTSINFTDIPSWVKRITILLAGVSTSGTSNPLFQIGDSGGIEATGYGGAGTAGGNAASPTVTSYTTGFGIPSAAAGNMIEGTIVLTLLNPATNLWVASGDFALSAPSPVYLLTAGSKTLSAVLDRIRVTTVGGVDTFDAGSINILYE